MKECGWKIYVHRHFFFSFINNYHTPEVIADLGETGAVGRKASVLSVSPSINHILQSYMGRKE